MGLIYLLIFILPYYVRATDFTSLQAIPTNLDALSNDEEELYSEMMSFIDSYQVNRVLHPLNRIKSDMQERNETLSTIGHTLQQLEEAIDTISLFEKRLEDRNRELINGTFPTTPLDTDTFTKDDSTNRSPESHDIPISIPDLNAKYIQHSSDMLLRILQSALEKFEIEKENQSIDYISYVWDDKDDKSVLFMLQELTYSIESILVENMTKNVTGQIRQEALNHIHSLQTQMKNAIMNSNDRPVNQTIKEGCMGVIEAATIVQTSLHQEIDYSQKLDHLQGSSVVYGSSWTSETLPITREWFASPWNGSDFNSTKNMPPMLEKMLPSGWNITWNLARLILTPLFSTLYTFMMVPSPETLLSSDLSLGSCWPFEGTRGKVSFRLPYPIIAEEISVEHYPTQFDTKEYLLLDRLSAPRMIRIMGYPPCDKTNCQSLGFDANSPVLLGTYEYKLVPTLSLDRGFDRNTLLTSRSIQTFPILSDDFNKNSSQNATYISAVTVYIDSNWGNDNFTCVYRIKLHGKKDDK